MNILYNIIASLMGFGINIAANFNPKAKLSAEGRKDWRAKMNRHISPDDKVIWVHCSSLGEFEQGRPVMEKLKTDYPNHKLAVSFFSPSGYEVRKDYKDADYIFYLPFDTKSNVKDLVQLLHPSLLILVKYEYWFNLLEELNKNKIPVIVISAFIKENSHFLKSYGGWFKKRLATIDRFFVQDENSKKLLEAIGINHVSISGDTRFDRVKEIRESKPELEFMDNFKGNSKLIVAGSTWPGDEEILVHFINEKLPDNWKVIFAPHNIDAKQIHAVAEKIRKKTAIYTRANPEEINQSQILIVDTVGMLTKIYAYSDISYVGGGFTKTGVHNTLEPAVFGVPVIFGPNYDSYLEAVELLENKAAYSFKNYEDCEQTLSEWIHNESLRKEIGDSAYNYIQKKPNSTKMIMEYVREKLPK